MSAYHQIKTLLEKHRIDHQEVYHESVRTSEEAASIRSLYGTGLTIKNGMKSLLVRLVLKDKTSQVIMIVVPGSKKMNANAVKKFFNAKEIKFLSHEEVFDVTSGVEVGGVPPFGNIFDLPTYFDAEVLENEKIVFNAGDKCVSIIMDSKDWYEVVKPIVIY
ncbi:hypothetical protein IPJ91_00340 [bacterium]|nr:MAG: hypothetical protein IPJ91_00340 [bacterium]